MGLIEKRGNRSYVIEHLPSFRLDGDDRRKLRVRELFAVREILEPPIVRLAVQKASEDERQRIADIARQFQAGMPLEEFRHLDRQFHWALATACGNETLAELSGKVLDSLFASDEFHELLGSRDNDAAVADVIDTSVRAHHRIAEAIESADASRAVEEITAHLHDVEDQMVSRMS
ncbi:MAG: FCD domain-containing protein [Acidimicrobiales bacterium]|nr:FCD domain-containing protein [Acidimicrobiales bacterium]